MTTGAFWNVSNPTKPWGLFDKDAQLDLPFDWSAWLLDSGASYVSHSFEPSDALEVVSSVESAGVIVALVRVKVGFTPTIGQKYPLTIKIEAITGSMTLKDDRTVYLKIVER